MAATFVGLQRIVHYPGSFPATDGAARERVVAAAAEQFVNPGSAIDPVGAVIAGEVVGVRRAGYILEAGEGVALGMPTGGRARAKVHRDGPGRRVVVQGVVTLSAGKTVRSGATVDVDEQRTKELL